MRLSRGLGWGLALAGLGFGFGANAFAEDCTKLAQAKLPHARVTAADLVIANDIPADLAERKLPGIPLSYCRVQGQSHPTADSQIGIEVWIPLAGAWNGKFTQIGNGGFAGAIPYPLMLQALSQGYAVAGTDDGHIAKDSTDASWALGHKEKIIDYGWRAIKETADLSPMLIRAMKAKKSAKAYFLGCSDGGREALMMAQRYPATFDGIVAGAPANGMTKLLTASALMSQRVERPGYALPKSKLAAIQAHALTTCGNGKTYIDDPRQCKIDLAALTCKGEETDKCLTPAQIETVQAQYDGVKDPVTGDQLYGFAPGAEAVPGSWDAWHLEPRPETGNRPIGPAFAWNYMAYMVTGNPKLSLAEITPAQLAQGAKEFAPIIDSNDPDLSRFKSHGGKLVQFHGWNDPAISPYYSLDYASRLRAKTAGTDEFYRLYMVPGMLHCRGGNAPVNVDWLSVLDTWVTKGTAPGKVTAIGAKGTSQELKPE